MTPETWLIEAVRNAATEVFWELGTGHTETVYESALEVELGLKDISSVRRQVPCPISYKGHVVGAGFIDILVDNILVVEIKTIAKLTFKEEAQVRKYLLGTGLEAGLLINFGQFVEILEVVPNDKE